MIDANQLVVIFPNGVNHVPQATFFAIKILWILKCFLLNWIEICAVRGLQLAFYA
jgi:hypothetical protein